MKVRLPSPYIPHKPQPKQLAFLAYDGLEAFYGGAAAGGKSDALLMAALQYVDIPSYAGMIFRRTYADLALPGALMDRARAWLVNTDAKWERETHTWSFPSGAKLSFGYVQTPGDKWRYQSSELQYIGWDEITDFPDDDAYVFMFSRLRRLEGSDIPLRVRSASNPVGIGAAWVKERFVEPAEGEKTKGIFIPANFHDNEYIDQEAYYDSLKELPESTQKRLIDGSWDEVEDSAFPEFNVNIHVIDPIAIPYDWRRWEGMDFGVSNPTAWYSAALSPDGHTVIHGEYYSEGLISKHASAILTYRENAWGQPQLALCDPSIKSRTGFGTSGVGDTVHSEFSKNGIYLIPANNDRRVGRVRISELLRPNPSLAYPPYHRGYGSLGSPGLFITSNCKNLIKQLTIAPLDAIEGETVDPFWETKYGHGIAAMRYLLTARVYPNQKDNSPQGRSVRQWKAWPQQAEPYG